MSLSEALALKGYRITSYNVCYTKLLRVSMVEQVDTVQVRFATAPVVGGKGREVLLLGLVGVPGRVGARMGVTLAGRVGAEAIGRERPLRVTRQLGP